MNCTLQMVLTKIPYISNDSINEEVSFYICGENSSLPFFVLLASYFPWQGFPSKSTCLNLLYVMKGTSGKILYTLTIKWH